MKLLSAESNRLSHEPLFVQVSAGRLGAVLNAVAQEKGRMEKMPVQDQDQGQGSSSSIAVGGGAHTVAETAAAPTADTGASMSMVKAIMTGAAAAAAASDDGLVRTITARRYADEDETSPEVVVSVSQVSVALSSAVVIPGVTDGDHHEQATAAWAGKNVTEEDDHYDEEAPLTLGGCLDNIEGESAANSENDGTVVLRLTGDSKGCIV